MNLNILNELNKLSPILDVIKKFGSLTFSYIENIIKLVGINNMFISAIIGFTILYYMLNGGLLKNWWKIALAIVLGLLLSKTM